MPSSPADLEFQLYHQGADEEGPFYGLRLSFQLPGSGEREVFSAPTPLRFDEDALRARKLGDYSRYGEELARQLLADGDVCSRFTAHLKVAASHARPVHIRLFLDPNALRLHGLLWETLRLADAATPLFNGENIRFSRYLSKGEGAAAASMKAKPAAAVRGLVAVAAPNGLERLRPPLAPVDVLKELQTAHDGLGDIPADDLVSDAAATGRVNLTAIAARLRAGYDILYLVAHGWLPADGEPRLCLEKGDGTPDWVRGSELTTTIMNLSPDHRPQLVVLVSCQSAGADGEWLTTDEGALAGLGPRLAAAGVPAVIAMQGNLKMATAAIFLPVFFAELRRDGQVERAMAVARNEALDKERPDWWMPVLFTRLVDGRVWLPGSPDARPEIETERFEPETVYIPAGPFLMGSPPDKVDLAAYRIGKFPVMNWQYQVFLHETKRGARPEMRWDGGQPFKGEEEHPVTGVTWCDALAYCHWLSGKTGKMGKTGRTYTLPSEAQWERAARGVDGRTYPWGNEWQDGRCHVSKEGVASVKLYPAQIEHGGQGVFDLVGNAPEWTRTIWGLEPLEPHYPQPWQDDGRDDLGANSQMRRIVRGGAASDPPEKLRCAARSSTLPLQPGPFGKRHGFRVMMVLGPDRPADSFCGSEGSSA